MNRRPFLPPLARPPEPLPRRRTPLSVWLRWGCLGALLALLLPLVLCSLAGVVYMVFPPDPLTVLVLGVDARPGEGYFTRTDSIMLLHIQPRQMQVSLLSIPRDLLIDTPGYGLQRINTINVLGEQESPGGGPPLLEAAIEASFGIEVDYYIRVNFAAFEDVVDTLGGVDIEVTRTIIDDAYPTEDNGTRRIEFQPGWQHMDGATALIYARTRHADDDYQRAGRQQQVVMAVLGKLAQPGSWLRLPGVLRVFFDSVDTNMTAGTLMQVAPPTLMEALAGEFDRLVVDRGYITTTGAGQAVPNYAAIQPWLDAHFTP